MFEKSIATGLRSVLVQRDSFVVKPCPNQGNCSRKRIWMQNVSSTWYNKEQGRRKSKIEMWSGIVASFGTWGPSRIMICSLTKLLGFLPGSLPTTMHTKGGKASIRIPKAPFFKMHGLRPDIDLLDTPQYRHISSEDPTSWESALLPLLSEQGWADHYQVWKLLIVPR